MDGLLCNPQFFCKGRFRPSAFTILRCDITGDAFFVGGAQTIAVGGVASGRFEEKCYFILFVIEGSVFPCNCGNFFDSSFPEGMPAVDAVDDDGRFYCCIATGIVDDPLNRNWRKVSARGKGFNRGANGPVALRRTGIDKLVPR